MSFQSDFLCQEDQSFLLENIDINLIDGLHNENTLAIDELEELKCNIPKLTSHSTILSNEEYDGPFNFDVTIHVSPSKNPWVYSALLNKVYMDMKSPFPVDFRVKARPNYPLFIRVTPMFSSAQFAQFFVYRCLNHEFNTSPDETEEMRAHVIRCHNPHTAYLGNKDQNERLSLLIPFSHPQTGTESVREIFEFLCKNSCPSPGMNRRAIEVIFTLEDEHGEILGRKVLNVRVCSCPKRDKEKDERERDNAEKPSRGKKRKIVDKGGKKVSSFSDNQEYLKIPIFGKHIKDQILKYCQDLYSGEIIRQGNSKESEPYKQALKQINALIKNNE